MFLVVTQFNLSSWLWNTACLTIHLTTYFLPYIRPCHRSLISSSIKWNTDLLRHCVDDISTEKGRFQFRAECHNLQWVESTYTSGVLDSIFLRLKPSLPKTHFGSNLHLSSETCYSTVLESCPQGKFPYKFSISVRLSQSLADAGIGASGVFMSISYVTITTIKLTLDHHLNQQWQFDTPNR